MTHSCPEQPGEKWSRADPGLRVLGDEKQNKHPNRRGRHPEVAPESWTGRIVNRKRRFGCLVGER